MSDTCCNTCGQWPCLCCADAEIDGITGYCNPGLVTIGTNLGVYDEDGCPKQLVPFRDDEDALAPAFVMQDSDGNIVLTDQPCISYPEDTEAAALIVKDETGCHRELVGDADQVQELEWDGDDWQVVPKLEGAVGLCTLLGGGGFTLDPAIMLYTITVAGTQSFVDGINIAIDGREFLVDEVLSDTQIRIIPMETPAAVEAIPAGTFVCPVGFRPCPNAEEANPTKLVFCEDNLPVEITPPADIAAHKVPFTVWRGQDGLWRLVVVPVDAVTGLPTPNYVLGTIASPVDGNPNNPAFRQLAGPYVEGYDFVGASLAYPTLNFTLPATAPSWLTTLEITVEGTTPAGGAVVGIHYDGTLLRAVGGTILAGWGGPGWIQHASTVDSQGRGYAMGEALLPGAHAFTFSNLANSISPLTYFNAVLIAHPNLA